MMGGLSYMTGPVGRPLRAGTSVNDIMGGMFGAIGVLAALRERDRTGRGQEVQSALFENCVFLSAQNMQQHLMTGEPVPPMPSRVSAWSVYDVFTLKDDEQLFIGAVSDRQFLILCRVLEAPELAADPALATNEKRVAVRPELLERSSAEILRHHDVAELVAQARGRRPAVRADRQARAARPRPAPEGKRRPGADADRRRRHDRRRPAADHARRSPPRRAPAAAADRRTYRRDPRLPAEPARQALSERTHGPLPHRRQGAAGRRLGLRRRGSDAHRRGQRRRARDASWPARSRAPTTSRSRSATRATSRKARCCTPTRASR